MLKFIHFNGMLVGEQLPNSALHRGHLKRPRLTNHHNVSMGCFLKNEYCLALPNFFGACRKCFGPDLIKSVWFFIEILVHAVLCYMPNCSSTFKRFLISGWELNVTGDVRISTNRCSSAILLIPFQKIAAETKQYISVLRQLKDFDERAAKELAAKAYMERERRRLEVSQWDDNIAEKSVW